MQATSFVIEGVAASAVEQAVVSASVRAVASVPWTVASAAVCNVHVAWAGIEKLALVDTGTCIGFWVSIGCVKVAAVCNVHVACAGIDKLALVNTGTCIGFWVSIGCVKVAVGPNVEIAW